MPDSAYIAALRMLGARELSEQQLRQRLTRRGYDGPDVDAAIGRLKEERSLDDERAARAMAHREATLRKRGRLRVKRQLEAAGLAASVIQRALDETFQNIDADTVLSAALNRRLRGRGHIADDREFQRLYRFLLGQGFEPDRILALLRSLRRPDED